MLFIAGPGGIGKSRVAGELSRRFGHAYANLDQEFNKRYGNISEYFNANGREGYYAKNSELFFELLNSLDNKTTFVLSWGFLVYDAVPGFAEKHQQAVKEKGFSVLLTPDLNIDVAANEVLKSKDKRGFTYERQSEFDKIKFRLERYGQISDVVVKMMLDPIETADRVEMELAKIRG